MPQFYNANICVVTLSIHYHNVVGNVAQPLQWTPQRCHKVVKHTSLKYTCSLKNPRILARFHSCKDLVPAFMVYATWWHIELIVKCLSTILACGVPISGHWVWRRATTIHIIHFMYFTNMNAQSSCCRKRFPTCSTFVVHGTTLVWAHFFKTLLCHGHWFKCSQFGQRFFECRPSDPNMTAFSHWLWQKFNNYVTLPGLFPPFETLRNRGGKVHNPNVVRNW